MSQVPPGEKAEIYVVLNPVAGNSSADEIREALESCFDLQDWTYSIYETTGKENVAELVSAACKGGSELIVAAGGDGTVAGAVNGLIGHAATLGIVPVGTGNGLARALGIPLEVKDAIELLSQREATMPIDAMRVGNQYYILNVSAGISARAMRNTPAEQKRRFGMLAYVWAIVVESLGFRPRWFNLVVDHHKLRVRATEIMVSNGRMLKEPPFPLGPRERFCDGQFDVYIVSSRSVIGYLRTLISLLRGPRGRRSSFCTLTVRKSIRIETPRGPQPVQADGEVIGLTPVEISLAPKAIRVIVPAQKPQ